ncbi:MAG: hypothetical protein R3D70_25270, partial [Rhizobiaceae bacterium]
TLTQLSQQLRHQHSWHQLSSYSTNRSTNPLQVANNHLSSQMPSVAQLASVSRQPKARDAIRAVEAAFDEFCKAVASRDEQFAARLGQHEGKLSELEQRARELDDKLESLRTNFDTAMSAWQAAFTEDQTSRAEEYSSAQIERANEFATSLRKWRDLAEQEVKAIKTNYDKALGKELERFRDEVAARLADVRDKHAAILEIHGLVGTDGVAGGYQRGATEEHDSANLWRIIAMGSFALAALWMLAKYCWGFDVTPSGGVNWPEVVTAASLTLVLLGAGGYAARQSGLHRVTEQQMRWFALEVKAIDPFLSSLPAPQRDPLKMELSQKLFGQNRVAPGKSEDKVDLAAIKTITETITNLAKAVGKG